MTTPMGPKPGNLRSGNSGGRHGKIAQKNVPEKQLFHGERLQTKHLRQKSEDNWTDEHRKHARKIMQDSPHLRRSDVDQLFIYVDAFLEMQHIKDVLRREGRTYCDENGKVHLHPLCAEEKHFSKIVMALGRQLAIGAHSLSSRKTQEAVKERRDKRVEIIGEVGAVRPDTNVIPLENLKVVGE